MSTLAVGTLQSTSAAPPTVRNTSGTEIGTFCRAWVNLNGTGTIAIRAAFNVSAITDNGVGDYTVNFTTAMPDPNYAWHGTAGFGTSSAADGMVVFLNGSFLASQTTTSVRVYVIDTNAATPFVYDVPVLCVSVFR